MDDEVAYCAANTINVDFRGLVSGRLTSLVDFSCVNSLGAAEMYLRSTINEVRFNFQAVNSACWNFLVPVSKAFIINRQSGSIGSSVETPVFRFDANGSMTEILTNGRVGTMAVPQDFEVTGTLRKKYSRSRGRKRGISASRPRRR